MKKMKQFLTALLTGCILVLSACGYSNPVSESFWSMDTFMKLELYGTEEDAAALKAEIARLDGLLSTTNENSDIFKLNSSGTAEVDESCAELVSESLQLCGELDGALDISVYPIVEEWGFISKNYKIPSAEKLSQLLENADYQKVRVSGNKITLPENMKIDLGAVAKGYAADRLKAELEKRNVASGILNLGGTVLAYGEKPSGSGWRVGIADPENTAAHFGSVECKNQVVATSGGYERYFEGDDGKIYCHIIDPQTGYPVDNGIVSVSVISESGVRSDALSTALFVMGVENAEKYWESTRDFDYIILDKHNNVYVTGGIADSFRLSEGYDFDLKVVSG